MITVKRVIEHCNIIDEMYKRPRTVDRQQGWLKMQRIKTKILAEEAEPCKGRGFYSRNCPCPDCRRMVEMYDRDKKGDWA
jgi:hypothetical protein